LRHHPRAVRFGFTQRARCTLHLLADAPRFLSARWALDLVAASAGTVFLTVYYGRWSGPSSTQV